jgi:hypothetical protein
MLQRIPLYHRRRTTNKSMSNKFCSLDPVPLGFLSAALKN